MIDLLMADGAHGPGHLKTIELRGERAVTLFKLGRHEDALAEAQWVLGALERHPDVDSSSEQLVDMRWQCGVYLLHLSRNDEALAVFTALDTRYSHHPAFGVEHRRIRDAREMRRAILAERIEKLGVKAERRRKEGRPEEALALCDRLLDAIADHPKHGPESVATAKVLRARGLTLDELGRQREAITAHARACELFAAAEPGPGGFDALHSQLFLACSLLMASRYREAREEVDRILSQRGSSGFTGPVERLADQLGEVLRELHPRGVADLDSGVLRDDDGSGEPVAIARLGEAVRRLQAG